MQQLNISDSDLINRHDTSGDTPLIIAVKRKEAGIVRHLVEDLKCDVNMKNIKGETALHLSCMTSLTIVKLLHTVLLDVNCQTKEGNTPLHIACTNRRYDIIEYLLDNAQCRADIPNSQGNLPLHVVTSQYREPEFDPFYGLKEEVDISLNMSELIIGKLTSAVTVRNNKGDTPLQMICRSGKINVLKVLIKQVSINLRIHLATHFFTLLAIMGRRE